MARLTAQQKVERDARIVADRAAGLTWPTIARRHDLTERQSQEIVKSHRAAQPPFESRDPVDAVAKIVQQLDHIIEAFALVAAETQHDAVRVGALRSQLPAMGQRLAVMTALGLVPSLPLVRRDVDLRRLLETMIGVLRRTGVSDEVLIELRDTLDSGLAWSGENGRLASSRS